MRGADHRSPGPCPMPQQSGRGYFITLEGPEGSGKSSQGRWLARRLRQSGHRTVFLRDPGSTSLGRALRRALLHSTVPLSPFAEALCFIGARVALVEEQILPALRRGRIVVCDRFHDSTMAYQGFGGELDVARLQQMGRQAIHGVMPQLTLLLDLPVERGFARLRRSRDRMERKTRAFHRRVRQGFLALARREPRRMVVIDATQPIGAVRRAIERTVLIHLSRPSS